MGYNPWSARSRARGKNREYTIKWHELQTLVCSHDEAERAQVADKVKQRKADRVRER